MPENTERPYPPVDDRLRHLLAQRINCHVDTWKLAFFIAGAIVDDPTIVAELRRVEAKHAAGEPCGDRNCAACFASAITAAPAVDRCTCRQSVHTQAHTPTTPVPGCPWCTEGDPR